MRSENLGFSRLKLFLALSRTPHGVLDLAAPALAALLYLGQFPPVWVTALGLLTVFAGYTAVYALNDLVDHRVDCETLRLEGGPPEGHYLDAAWVRHPLAACQLSLREGLLWTGFWALVALLGAYALNPVCALIFICGCLLEAAYCLLLKVSPLRFLVAGLVKGLGALAAVFAVEPQPAPLFLLVLFLWLFFWELGGQNIPADWHDVEQDRSLKAKTIPVVLGLPKAGVLSLVAAALALVGSVAVIQAVPTRFTLFQLALVLWLGYYLVLLPAWRLARGRTREEAADLFNRASYYPLGVLVVVLLNFLSRAALPAWV